MCQIESVKIGLNITNSEADFRNSSTRLLGLDNISFNNR